MNRNYRILIDGGYFKHMCMAKATESSAEELTLDDYKSKLACAFFSLLKQISLEYSTYNFFFCLDDNKEKLVRRMIYPDYKLHREIKYKEQSEEEQEKYKVLYEYYISLFGILKKAGFEHVIWCSGFEADDIIAELATTGKDHFNVIVANDSDLFQLLSDNVQMYNLQSGLYFSPELFKLKYGIDVSRWVEIKSAVGDTADNIVGIEGVGDKSYIKYLNGELPKFTKAKKTNKKFAIIEECREQVLAVNIPIVRLPMQRQDLRSQSQLDLYDKFKGILLKHTEDQSIIKESKAYSALADLDLDSFKHDGFTVALDFFYCAGIIKDKLRGI